MNKLLVNLVCLFIPQKKNRRHFREKFRYEKKGIKLKKGDIGCLIGEIDKCKITDVEASIISFCRIEKNFPNFYFSNKYYKKLKNEPINPFAFIRVCNEIETLKQSLTSILPAIKRGVIGYHNCNDGSEEFILDFCNKNNGFIPYKYTDCTSNLTGEKRAEFLTDYYNKVLAFIPKNEWLIKIDCDQIYESEKLIHILKIPQSVNDIVILARLNLHYTANELYFIKDAPILFTEDHWLIHNHNLKFISFYPIFDCELLQYDGGDFSKRKNIYTEISNFHFPFIKKSRANMVDKKNLIKYDDFINSPTFKIYKNFNEGLFDEKMLNKDFILGKLDFADK